MSTKQENSTTRIKASHSLLLTASMAALALGAPTAIAQDAEGEETAKRLNTVTVTSQKREQTLQDVPIAVSVVDAAVIEKAEIRDISDLQSVVPSLRVTQGGQSAATTFLIRGFGNGAGNVGVEPSVGVFIDGIYRSRSAAAISDLPNLERVEVLRGPQSTLFGKNASAGVISVVTKKAQFTPSGYVEGSLSNFEGRRVRGYYTGPISDTVAFSIAGNYNQQEGFATNLTTGENFNERNRFGVQGELLFTPNDQLEIRILGDYDEIDEDCCIISNIVSGPATAVLGFLGGNIVAEDPFSDGVFYNIIPENEVENHGFSAQVDYEMDFATFTSITGYRGSTNRDTTDSDHSSTDLFRGNSGQDIETFTQEFRLTSNSEGPVDWMVGGFYFDEEVDDFANFAFGPDFRPFLDLGFGNAVTILEGALALPAGTLSAPGQGTMESYNQENTAYSVFGTLDYHVTDKLTATVGLNYTNDEKEITTDVVVTDIISTLDFVALGGGITDPTLNPLLGFQALQFLPPFQNLPNGVEDNTTNDDQVTYTLRLAYDVNDNINVYASHATGFKASSWNLSFDSAPFASDIAALQASGEAVTNLAPGTRFAKPENATVSEIGVKGQFDNFGFNLAIFDQKIEDFQTNIFLGTGFVFSNADEQSSTGIEIETTWVPVEGLTLGFAGTFLDPEYDSFPNSTVGDLSGETPAGIAETAFSTTANYDFSVGDIDAFVRADWQYEGPTDYFDDPANQALINDEREVSIVNASAGIVTPGDLAVSLWARNLFDERFVVGAFPSVLQTGSLSGSTNQPRTYGVTIRKSF